MTKNMQLAAKMTYTPAAGQRFIFVYLQ